MRSTARPKRGGILKIDTLQIVTDPRLPSLGTRSNLERNEKAGYVEGGEGTKDSDEGLHGTS
jgi:hypothetical protein